LDNALQIQQPSALEEAGIVQAFEFTFELAWKMLKDYLTANGVDAPFPRDVLKQAFRYGLITNGALWLEMLDKRNQMAHTYNETNAQTAMTLIRTKFAPPIAELYAQFTIISKRDAA
jgi:nucleotidyltransferase substrate binding protein (TIGR01987 family)